MKRFRPDPFFQSNPEDRAQRVEERRARRLINLRAKFIKDGRILVESTDPKSSSTRYYYLDHMGPTPRCYCLDSARGNDRCKHVLAGLAFQGDGEVVEKVEAYGGESEVEPYNGPEPVSGTLNRALGKIKKETWPWEGEAEATWLLTHPKADKLVWEATAQHATSMLALLGLLRDPARVTDEVVSALISRVDMGVVEHATLMGRLLPWLNGEQFTTAWDYVRQPWLETQPLLVAQILRAAGRGVTRQIPKEDVLVLFKHSDPDVRQAMLGALRTSGIEPQARGEQVSELPISALP